MPLASSFFWGWIVPIGLIALYIWWRQAAEDAKEAEAEAKWEQAQKAHIAIDVD